MRSSLSVLAATANHAYANGMIDARAVLPAVLRAGLLVSVLALAPSLAACDRAATPAPEASTSARPAAESDQAAASTPARVEPWLPVDAAFKGCAGG
jgi:hypothetical protein